MDLREGEGADNAVGHAACVKSILRSSPVTLGGRGATLIAWLPCAGVPWPVASGTLQGGGAKSKA